MCYVYTNPLIGVIFLISDDEKTSEYFLGDLQRLGGRGVDVFVALGLRI